MARAEVQKPSNSEICSMVGTDDHMDFQAEYLPIGSVSFGRFGTENLSWERKSSFCHNRYLEEVERYSTKGSVTEKKVYFEAHFRKKDGLFQQLSYASRSEKQVQTAQYRNEGQSHCMGKYDELYVEDEQLVEFPNYSNDGVQFSWYDESPVLSGEIKDDAVDGEEDEVISHHPLTSNSAPEVGTSIEVSIDDEKFSRTQEREASQMIDKNIPTCVEVENASEIKNITRTSKDKDSLAEKVQLEENNSSHSKSTKKVSKVVKGTFEKKTTKLRSSPVQTLQRSSSQKTSPPYVATSSTKTEKNTGMGTPSKVKADKHHGLRPSSVTLSVAKTVKPKDESEEAKIKPFRSHGFKARPMPSFYHENIAKGASTKKASARSPTPQPSRCSPLTRVTPHATSPSTAASKRESTNQLGSRSSNVSQMGSSAMPRRDATQIHRDRLQKAADVRTNTKTKKNEPTKKDERIGAKPAPSQGDFKVKKHERMNKMGGFTTAKAMKSNPVRASPAIHVAS